MRVLCGLAVLVLQCSCEESTANARPLISVDGLVQKWWDVFNIEKKTTTSNPFDCYTGESSEWPDLRRRWCCEHLGLGCPSLDMPAIPSAYMCSVGDPDKDWSPHQRQWCCHYDHRGCDRDGAADASATTSGILTSPRQLDNTTTVRSTLTGTVREITTPLVLPSSTTRNLRPSSTTSGMDTRSPAATTEQLATGHDSTAHQKLGAHAVAAREERHSSTTGNRQTTYTTSVPVQQTTTTEAPYNCEVGFEDWVAKWSHGKRSWCCRSFGLGCTTANLSMNAEVTHSDTSSSTPAPPSSTSSTSITTITTTTKTATTTSSTTSSSGLYDCSRGFFNWRQAWSVEKRQWCCVNAMRGCPYNCIGDTLAVQLWSNEKRQWCCAFQERGCPITQFPTVPAVPTVAMPAMVTLAPPPPLYMGAFERVDVRESHQRSYFGFGAMASAFAITFGAALMGFTLFQLVGVKYCQRRRDAGYREMLNLDSAAFICPE